MRAHAEDGPLRVRAVAGTRVVLMAWDMDAQSREGLRGFAIKKQDPGGGPAEWLKGLKYYAQLVPDPKKGHEYLSREDPFQTFLWSDYGAEPNTTYGFTIVALYGDIPSLQEKHSVRVEITTEKESYKGHGVWFNRGAIASHALATEFSNTKLTPEMVNRIDANGQIVDKEVRWLSRGLAEACIAYINSANPGEGLRVCAYEFTYQPILKALKRAIDRGVDVRIIYHYTKKEKDPNLAAIGLAELPERATVGTTEVQVLFQRTRTAIPHNKFIVRLSGGKAREVWTGSTNFTDTAFLGQTNVGHLVLDEDTADLYQQYWEELKDDPTHLAALAKAVSLTPNPPNAIGQGTIVPFYSPRVADNMLDWYAKRIEDAVSLAVITIPFNVAPAILQGLSRAQDALRLVILEDEPTPEVTGAEKASHGRLAFSNGAILGKSFIRYARSGGKLTPIPNSKLEEWFVEEELARPINNGFVFFVHSKFLLIDPLSDDPLVCSGSANFSKGSLENNDENMLLIRGDTRIADIYFTEFDRIFRHFYARDWVNRFAEHGDADNPLLLDTGFAWIESHYKTGTYKNNRRLMFFPENGNAPGTSWSQKAQGDPDAFADEQQRAAAERKGKNDARKARKPDAGRDSR